MVTFDFGSVEVYPSYVCHQIGSRRSIISQGLIRCLFPSRSLETVWWKRLHSLRNRYQDDREK